MSNASAAIASLANRLGNNDPQVLLDLEKIVSAASADAVTSVLAGVNADADTLLEVRALVLLRAPIASPTFTGTVGGVTAAMVGAVPTGAVPATAAAAGTAGQFSYDATNLYVCIASGQWVKCTLATWE